MKRTIVTALAAASLLALSACGQQAQEGASQDTQAVAADAFEGNWKADLASSQYEDQPDVYLLRDGQYNCSSCNPPLTVAADGKFHAVADRPYYDSMAVTIVDDRTVKFERRKGDSEVGSSTLQVSPDGKTMNSEFVDKTTATPVSGKGTSTRVAAAPAGAHAVSGSWKANRLDSLSEEALAYSYNVEGDTVRYKSGEGLGYEATVGGPEVPVQGDPSGLVVAVTQPSANTIVETYKRDGKVVGVATLTIGADGGMSGVYENKVGGSTTRWMASKQS